MKKNGWLPIHSIILLLSAFNINAQNCSPDLLEPIQLIEAPDGESSHLSPSKYFNLVTSTDELSTDTADGLIHAFPNIRLQISASYIEDGAELYNLEFLISTGDTFYQWHMELNDAELESIEISRPDSINHPEIIEVRHKHGFGSPMGTYSSNSVQLWNTATQCRLASYNIDHTEFYREVDINGNFVVAHNTSYKRKVIFSSGTLIFKPHQIVTSTTTMQKDEKGEEQEIVKTNISDCLERIFLLKNDRFELLDIR